jgi:hypothetical protein
MFVIMLDHHLDVFLHDWPISGRAKTLEEARKIFDYDGSPDLVQRDGLALAIRENKSLINRLTMRAEAGAIYEVL